MSDRRTDSPLLERYGPWALVTGASSGIGEGLARALAEHGFDLVLVARRHDRLQAIAGELARQFGVSTRTVEIDLAVPGAAARVADAVDDLDVGLLVNNAGTGWIGRFGLQDADEYARQIRLNASVPVELTAALLDRLRARPRSAVLVVSSMGAFVPLPYYAVYGATKAFVQSWGEALGAELEDDGVDVLLLAPGDTATGFQEVAGEQSTNLAAVEDVVAAALAGLGERRTVVPGWDNRLAMVVARFLPRSLVARLLKVRQRDQTPEDRRG